MNVPTPSVEADYEKSIAEAQAAIDKGARFGKSRLAQARKSAKAVLKRRAQRKAQREARKAQR